MGEQTSELGKQLMEFMEEITMEVVERGGIHDITDEELQEMFDDIGGKHNGKHANS
jgi:hypothetical protein